jgi:hypothetical protein
MRVRCEWSYNIHVGIEPLSAPIGQEAAWAPEPIGTLQEKRKYVFLPGFEAVIVQPSHGIDCSVPAPRTRRRKVCSYGHVSVCSCWRACVRACVLVCSTVFSLLSTSLGACILVAFRTS